MSSLIRVCLIGAGRAGRVHANSLVNHAPKASLAAVVDGVAANRDSGQAILVCTNREQGLITPIYRTWPERFAWGYIREMEHFVSCIVKGTQPKVSAADGRWAVAGVLAGNCSWLEQRPVYLKEILDAA